ncbi:ABC transporter permease [Colwellia sp. MB3u-55]|uniref:ABC transporter permease n=1 Tax=Colwellia sp. MB3u-55 TaxID=2759810 RepID=UPI0015F764B6|nr:ABC transporter permease [Colwellia sp. MB3u-55]MBA6251191.1 ABC transporter permease [Colwellia sp. MB3u-55]
MNLFCYQLKQAYLSLKQKPIFVLSVVSTMGVTLGALLCVLTLAYVMLIKPLPYPDQERLYNVEHQLISNENAIDGRAFTYPNLMHLYNQQSLFEQSVLMYVDGGVITSLPSEPMVAISFITPQWFSLFSAKMALGKGFEESEKVNSYNPVAVLTYETWQNKFNGDINVLEKSLTLSGNNYQIIGVLAENNIEAPLAGAGFKTELYLPWDYNSVSERERKRWGNDDSGLIYVGKLNKQYAEYSKPQIDQILTKVVNENWQSKVSGHDFFKNWSIVLETQTLKSFIVSDGERSVYLLLIGSLGLLFIACANIANLFVSRTVERQQQLAISAAVGASKAQLFRNILAETGLLMFAAIILAQVVIFVGFGVLQYYLGDFLPRIDELELNAFSFSASILLLVLLTLTFSHLCLKMINYHALNATLQSGGKGIGIQVSKRVRNILISSQIATATALVFINVVLYKDASELVNQPLGYQTNNITSVVLALPNVESEIKAQKLTALKAELLAHPKIKKVSQAMRPTGFGTLALTAMETDNRYTVLGKDIDDQYFSMLKQAIIEGDNFSAADIKDDRSVMIVNDVFAQRLAPNGSAIGFKFKNGVEVIGVVKSINMPGIQRVESRFYYPASLARNMLLIEQHQGQIFNRDEMISAMKSVDKKLSLFTFTSLNEYKDRRLFSSVTTAVTTLVLAILTLLLSGLGLYGILNYSSQMRRFEIGTRMAIGAKGKDIVSLVFKDNAGALGIGLVVSFVVLLVLYLGFSDSLNTYISLELLPLFVITLGAIFLLSSLACYLPLRQFINKPVIHALKGSE